MAGGGGSGGGRRVHRFNYFFYLLGRSRERPLTYNHILRISAKELVGGGRKVGGGAGSLVLLGWGGMCPCWLGYVIFPRVSSSGCSASQKLTKKPFWGEGAGMGIALLSLMS